MKSLFAKILGNMGVMMASISENSCSAAWLDEPEMPRSMIEK